MKKNSCAPVNPKKYSCYRLEKIHKKEFENEKKTAAAQKFPTPPHNFSNGLSLIWDVINTLFLTTVAVEPTSVAFP